MDNRFKSQGEKDLAGVLYNRGTMNAKNGNLSEAISDFTKAIELKPDDIMAYNNRGSAYAQQRDYIQAISDFTKAIGINPNDPVAYHNRAVAYYCLKEYDKACGDVQMVKDIGATVNPEIIRMLKEVTGNEEPEEKTLIFIEAVGLVFIVLSTIVFEFANNSIDEKRVEISDSEQLVNNLAIQCVNAGQHSLTTAFYRLNGLQMIPQENTDQLDPFLKDLANKFSNKKITNSQYLEGYFNYCLEQEKKCQTAYNEQILQLNKISHDGTIPRWQSIESLANTIRIFAIFLSVFLYYFLFRAIGKRIEKEKSNLKE